MRRNVRDLCTDVRMLNSRHGRRRQAILKAVEAGRALAISPTIRIAGTSCAGCQLKTPGAWRSRSCGCRSWSGSPAASIQARRDCPGRADSASDRLENDYILKSDDRSIACGQKIRTVDEP